MKVLNVIGNANIGFHGIGNVMVMVGDGNRNENGGDCYHCNAEVNDCGEGSSYGNVMVVALTMIMVMASAMMMVMALVMVVALAMMMVMA